MAQESVLRIVIDSRNAERNAHALANELESIEKKGDFATKSMDSMSVATRQLAGYMAGIVTVGAAINKMDTYTGINNKLKLVTKSQEELNQAMRDTFAIAQKSASSWGAVNDVYSKYMSNAKTLNLTQAQTARLTEITSKAVSLSGSSSEAAAAALFQYGQALDGNILRAEEYNSLVDGAGGLLNAMAKGLGVARGELRQMMLDGKLTGEVITKALLKAGESVDALYAKTDITIGQSITMLSNQATKFTGEAGKASGAAVALSSSIQFLANNLDTIANITIVGGVAFLTKTIVAQTVAIQGSIAASAQRRAADTAALQSQVQLAAIEVQRTRQVTALAITEVGLARQELNSATTRQARAAATMRLTQAEVALAIAQKQTKVATVEQIAAENALNASRSRGAAILGLVGGWTGALTIGVAALAAGYMYFSNRAAEANKKLEDQANVAKKAKEELIALKGLEKDKAVDDMTASFERQNKALSESSSKINMQLNAIQQLYKGNKEVAQVVQDARNGTISMNDAIRRFNELRIKKDVYEALKLNTTEFIKNAKEAINTKSKLSLFGIEVELAGKKAQTSAVGVDENTQALDKNETSAQRAAKAQKDFFNSLSTDVLSANENLAYLNLGFSKEVIEKIQELQKAKQAVAPSGTTAIVTTEEINQIVRAQKALDAVKDKEDEITKAKRDQTSEAEKQAKLAAKQAVIMAGSNEQIKNMLKVYQAFRNAGVDDVKARVLTAQVGREGDFLNKNLFGSHSDNANGKINTGMISWQGTRSKSLTQYLQGQGVLDQKGNIEQTQEALNAQAKFLIQEILTEKRYKSSKNALLGDNSNYRDLEKVFGKNAIAWDYNGKNIGSDKASKNLARQDNYYNFLNKILGGNPENALSSIKDLAKYDDEAYKARKDLLDRIEQLQSKYDTEAISRNKARDEEINQAAILGQQALIPKIKERYEAQEKLAKLQQEYEAEGYKWTEERKLQYTYETNVLRLTAEGKFSKDQKKIFEKGFKDQRDQEIALVRLAKEQRIFQAEQAMMTEIQAMQERYRLERNEIIKTTATDLEERRRRLNALNTDVIRGGIGKNFSDPNDTSSQFLQSVSYAPIAKSNTQKLDEEFEKEQAKMLSNFEKIKELNADNHEAILEAERQFLEAKQQLQDEYDFKAQDARKLDLEHQLSIYGQMTSMVGSSFGQMMDIVSQVKEENTKTYKTFFAINKAIAFAQAIINTEEGATKALAQGGIYGAALAMAVRASGYASAGIIAGQAIAGPGGEGYANGGYTGHGGKYDPAGIVHKGEGVLTQEEIKALGGPQGFEDLRKSIRRGYSAGGLVADTHRVGMGTMNAINNGGTIQAEKVAQASVKAQSQTPQVIDNQLRVLFVKDEDEAKDMLYGPDGEKAFLYHMKRNRSKV
ncbi:tape measure protein [Acinetobacter sp. G11]|uniref:tape measure protein n=1 Tax=Acinetobacter sp. G11 TaxID=3415989 RepID=UPI003C7C7634